MHNMQLDLMGLDHFDIYWVHNTAQAPNWTRALAEFFEGRKNAPMIGVAHARKDDALLRLLFDKLVAYTSSPEIRRMARYEMPDDYTYDEQCELGEELFDRLMDEIEAVGVFALNGFEELLTPRYPDRILAMYRKDLLGPGEVKPPVGDTRNSYARFASQVKHMRSIGDNVLAGHIIARVLELYPRRPALRDELSQA